MTKSFKNILSLLFSSQNLSNIKNLQKFRIWQNFKSRAGIQDASKLGCKPSQNPNFGKWAMNSFFMLEVENILVVIVLRMHLSSKEHENWIFIKLECWHRWTILVSIRTHGSLISPRAFSSNVAHSVHFDRSVVNAVTFALISIKLFELELI